MAVLAITGLACISLPSFESPGNIIVYRVSEGDIKVRVGAGWQLMADDPPEGARGAVTLAIKQERNAILEAGPHHFFLFQLIFTVFEVTLAHLLRLLSDSR